MTAPGRHRCACRAVLLGAGDAPVLEQIGVAPGAVTRGESGARLFQHARVACGPKADLAELFRRGAHHHQHGDSMMTTTPIAGNLPTVSAKRGNTSQLLVRMRPEQLEAVKKEAVRRLVEGGGPHAETSQVIRDLIDAWIAGRVKLATPKATKAAAPKRRKG